MPDNHDLDAAWVRLGSAIGKPARARMLAALLDGQAHGSTELAMAAGVSPSTASAHLAKLAAAGLIAAGKDGRHRRYRLRGPGVARMLEALAAHAAAPAKSGGRAAAIRTPIPLRAARSCYDHLAGQLGVALLDRLISLGWLLPAPADGRLGGYGLSQTGAAQLERLGVEVAAAQCARRRFATACLDWSERRPHLGGALGAEFLNTALEKNVIRRGLDSRAVELTSFGRRWLRDHLGLQVHWTQGSPENLTIRH